MSKLNGALLTGSQFDTFSPRESVENDWVNPAAQAYDREVL
jgi:hypothetical protein